MATTKDRINVSVSKSTKKMLEGLAKRDELPVATKAAELLELAIDIEEDRYLGALAEKRLRGKVRWVRDSDKVWK